MKRKFILCSFGIALLSAQSFAQKSRTVTNADLQKYQQQRLQAESDYDKRAAREELPTRVEIQRREQERLRFNQEFTRQAEAQQQQTENYFQSQATALRSDLAALDAEINYVAARVNEIPSPQTYYSVGYLPFTNYGGFNGGFGGVAFPQYPNGTSNSTTVTSGGIAGKIAVGSRNSGVTIRGGYSQTTVNQTNSIGISPNDLQAPQINLNSNNGVAVNGFGTGNFGSRTNLYFGNAPYTAGILSAEFTLPTAQNLTREELLARFRALEQARAGLRARFEVLEDEARRSGVKID